ncbi:glycosyltransferase [Desulfofundulus thermobenzoicus]|uniref:Glycosyltransferase n=1 Tax=Desulfofundulus thermobenzoicus TaxID=29376 RepID=A0A6N7IUW8_9FIRM|nr:glycosyltransferase family 2 protein [Desulfofundulus thermobenzoicus]MQL53915.1 glycosyltransferase [Desulfofundulus thermobenzoicus]
MLSVIIPTYNEEHNIIPVARQIGIALQDREYEIIFVDDSTDGTVRVLEKLALSNPRVRYIHRRGKRGLATAVVAGFQIAKGDILAVMDADLQHPPAVLPHLLNAIKKGNDLVIASRFLPGGSDGGLTPARRVISLTARCLGRLLLKKVRPISDPMSGFFMLRREVVQGAHLTPLGWKILMEVLVRGRYQRVAEVPYAFRRRKEDHSKMTLAEQVNYLRHLLRLVLSSPEDLRFWKFCLVGASGVVMNMFFFLLLTRLLRLDVILSALVATTLAMFSNFLLNDHFTWPGAREDQFFSRTVKFFLCCTAGMLINVAVLALLNGYLGLPAVCANGAGILSATLWNYYANNRWTWTAQTARLANENPDSR